ncbi:MAG: TetR/AcrR family transcriptional regulator [Oscillospiraceae bacterium]|nr:TetR/AcrR family transcriptional regulator [Oscillospiraceae bacterium]
MHENSVTKERILLEATLIFAHKGFAGMHMQELAQTAGITVSSLYNHYSSKKELWRAVLIHAECMFKLYLDGIEAELKEASNLTEIINIFFDEAKKMDNNFACYAFSLVNAEQLRSRQARRIFQQTFLKGGAEFISRWLTECIKRGWCIPFDSKTVGRALIRITLDEVELYTQHLMGFEILDDPQEILKDLEALVKNLLGLSELLPERMFATFGSTVACKIDEKADAGP